MTAKKDPLLKPCEVVEQTGRWSTRTLQRWRTKSRQLGRLIGPRWHEMNGDIYYRQSAIEKYLDESEARPEASEFKP